MLNEKGLHQLSRDDVEGEDAFSNLSDDGVLKNVITSRHFTYKEMKRYLRKKYFLQSLKCKENRFKNCIKVFSVM